MKIAVLTGGPSLERGISLNSARSVLDHLGSSDIEIVPIYFDHKKTAYKISRADLYSNNPSDFDFKLQQKSSPLNERSLVKLLKSVDIAMPAMHGAFGEDGELQAFLEKNGIPFVGSGSLSCKMAFDKYEANNKIRENGFFTLPSALLKIYSKDNRKTAEEFFKKNKVKKAIVKPATGGSSIGVFTAHSAKEAIEKAEIIFSKRMDTRVVLEPFAEGKEFTVIILQNKFGFPVAVMPTEIEMTLHEGRIFDFRKKYLPTNQVKYHCPPRFPLETIQKIRAQGAQIFSFFKMNDFARFDGWVLPNGEVWFSDFNTISGMEQNSFLFQQSSRLGMSHSDLLRYVIKNSCRRQKINFPEIKEEDKKRKKKPVSVIFGGGTSERQVSLMSGTNVWLKLRKSSLYEPKPYLLDFKGNVWELPYYLILNHTVEEIVSNAESAKRDNTKIESLMRIVENEIMLSPSEATEPAFLPRKMTFNEFLKGNKFVFLGLHGGDGENGNIQRILKSKNIKFNGSDEKVSKLCMDKFETGNFIRKIGLKGVSIAPQKLVSVKNLKLDSKTISDLWGKLRSQLDSKTLIVKPKDDGCSTGVAHLYTKEDLKNYLAYLRKCTSIPAGVLENQTSIMEMPECGAEEILFEKFMETDIVRVKGNKLSYIRKSGWVEVTIGVLETGGVPHAFNPSITVAEGEVLSLEEKFQGGTGINITPPPERIVKSKALSHSKFLVEELAKKIGIKGYARIDCFLNTATGELSVIEVNTLPGLTSSTVLYHQALAENPRIFPRELLENIIKNSGY
jgi:D-alanine--D-alanine ligase